MRFAMVKPINSNLCGSDGVSIDGITGHAILYFNIQNGTTECQWVEPLRNDNMSPLGFFLYDGQFEIVKEITESEGSIEQTSLSALMGKSIKEVRVEFYEERN